MSVWLPSTIGVRDTPDGPVIAGRDRAEFLAGLALKHLERVWTLSQLPRPVRCVNLWLLEQFGGAPLREIAARFEIAEAGLVAEAFEALCGRGAETLMDPATLERRHKERHQHQHLHPHQHQPGRPASSSDSRGEVEAKVMRAAMHVSVECESTSRSPQTGEAMEVVAEEVVAEVRTPAQAAPHLAPMSPARAAPIAVKMLRMQMAEAPEDG